MLYREIMAVCSEIHTKHINLLRAHKLMLPTSSTHSLDRIKFYSQMHIKPSNVHVLWPQLCSYFLPASTPYPPTIPSFLCSKISTVYELFS